MLRRLARLKFRLMRVTPYIQFFNTALLLSVAGWSNWYLLALVGFVVVYLFEKHFGIKGEMDLMWGGSQEWNDFKKKFDELDRRVP